MPNCFGGRSGDSPSADGSVPIEIGIGEAAGERLKERSDAHEVVVAHGPDARRRSMSASLPPV